MKKEIEFITIDGRGEHESFRDCITKAVKELKPNEGIHIIKDFEPFPMYKMMEDKGFDKVVEKVSDEEYHVYFTPKKQLEKIQMGEHLDLDDKKIEKIIDIKVKYLKGIISLQEAKDQMKKVGKVTAQEFAICEQYLQQYAITDDELAERMDEILDISEGVLVSDGLDLPEGHPIHTYLLEIKAIRNVLAEMKEMQTKKFIKNQWAELYEKLSEINIHFARKQNQLFAALESKGFDKPSKVMWTLDNNIRDIIKKAKGFLDSDQDQGFFDIQNEVIEMVEDMMIKEEEILFPTSMDLLEEEDFVKMRKGDDEIGYCLIETPVSYGDEKDVKTEISSNNELIKDLASLLQKHGVLGKTKDSNEVLDVSQGKMTLEQINLIFKHLNVDLSYVDENEVVKFYSDTKHRVFPRSPGVIGRKVQNCHPRESVGTVEEIIKAFKSGEQDEAEFWLELGGKFIYIIYTAVRDEEGNFRGVLEMMQDVTRIRSLEGSQRLLSWNKDNKEGQDKNTNDKVESNNSYGITKDTIIGELVKEYPFVKDFLLSLSPKFKKLKNPILFKTMSSIATLEMISQRGELDIEDVINKITKAIEAKSV
ncbi:hypothetical protein EDC18_103244 [Natranaerovirga pectinivora]|uniref:Uncharacterized protein n=1 Tax=Natranaerovirga pectinivora TaxID=682400 RepID=A0A4R3MLL1_9FIRM|nr:PAS domain-containing protein [Natranaerovirga pectinivora]TCT15538.1 hypothetical protein EDC18_103244 [Natranaerovirga pectinivora]